MLPQQLTELQEDEGVRLFVYDDATGAAIIPGSRLIGHPTIGYGRALDVTGITPTEASTLLANSLIQIAIELEKMDWYMALDDVRRGVIVNLSYNMGVHGVLMFARMIAYLQAQNWHAAGMELQNSKWATQVQYSRSSRLIRQLQTGQLDALTV